MVIDDKTYESLARVGKILALRGLNTSHSGNISIRSGGKMVIKRRAAMLGWLKREDLVETSLEKEDSYSLIASTESAVHRGIYNETDAMAIIHAHCPFCTTLSLIEDEITCIDAEGVFKYKRIPVIELDVPIGPKEAAEKVPPVLKDYKVCVVRSHGVFAKGMTIEDALANVTGAEHSAEIRYLTMLTRQPLKRDYSEEKSFKKW
ncbi:MAG: fuculose phosphate aldolase [Candidatus Korarchaeota archaeon]|nr:fuculose phosphate aldolase [Candidatus Korarchaeota archaeon]NIU83074.1 fuculose phosphate aldolase [Candidatus Thorarchaeota archaeon]NIW12618.1 fuculose phosphate aldolase [Candidatus Thorarchaeota archaeon]NIW50829.1 fuculose phosphate aldolase [Candidatus Korarchaeota archaeon]